MLRVICSMIAFFFLLPVYAGDEGVFIYRKGKTFDRVPAYRMEAGLNLNIDLKTVVHREQRVPPEQSTLVYRLNLPDYIEGLFFSRDFRPGDHSWPNNTNRLLPWFFRTLKELRSEDYAGIPSNGRPLWLGDALFLHLAGGKYLFIKALAGDNSLSWLQVSPEGTIDVYVSTLGEDKLADEVPLILSAVDVSPYEVVRKAYQLLAGKPEVAGLQLREQKKAVEPFSYLGWCTWEHYRRDIGERQLLEDIAKIEHSGIPIRYVLIDDGHVRNKAEQLCSFKPDSVKFPRGWEAVLNSRRPGKIRWMGLWYGFPGFWQGIAPENDFPEAIRSCLYPFGGTLLPGESREKITTYYRYYLETLKSYGFDFLKIDIQSFMLPLYMGGRQVVKQAGICNEALEEETHRLGLGLINCMAQNVLNMDRVRYSAVSRVSIDYKKFDEDMARSHLFQSYTNTLLQGQTVWPDHDMFHSCDSVCGEMMARSKALSGGPVYLSDAPQDFVPELIWPLVNKVGYLYRPEAPAVPAWESVFTNPVYSGKCYRVVAPVGERAMAMICYNLNKDGNCKHVTAVLRPEDYLMREGMTGRESVLPERLIVYDWKNQMAEELKEEKRVDIIGFTDRLFHFCPVEKGWAVIGLQEKYLSPATVKVISCTEKRLVVEALDEGTLKVWADQGRKPQLRSMKVKEGQRIVLKK